MTEKRRATLKDVAEAVGVHASTASRALHPSTRHLITDELAEKIVATARALKYRPNSIAYSLRTRRSMTIGVLVPDITNPVFPPIVRGMEDVLVPQGYTALVTNTDGDAAKASAHLQMLRERGVDGFIVASAERQDKGLADIIEERLPLVAVNRMTDHPDASSVVNDEPTGISVLIDHLVALGHRRIAHIAGPQGLSTGHARRKAFEARMAALGLAPALVVPADRFSEAEGWRCGHELLRALSRPTAIMAANDLLALGALRALDDLGLAAPDDVSVTGYNDIPFLDRLTPPLTTVRIQTYEAGRRAATRILEQIKTPVEQRRPAIDVLPVELVRRGSTGAPRA